MLRTFRTIVLALALVTCLSAAAETIKKLQPHRTVQLRGPFDRRGASGSIHSASATGFTASGIFRDQADFGVIELWNADNLLEPWRIRYLPDFDFSGIELQFDLHYTRGLRPIDSKLFSSIGTDSLQYISSTGASGSVPLFDLATYTSGTYTAASGTVAITSGTLSAFQGFRVWYQNIAFEVNVGSSTADSVAVATLRDTMNNFDWTGSGPPIGLYASASGATLTLEAGRYGIVSTSGTTVTMVSGTKFSGLVSTDPIWIDGTLYTVSSVTSPTVLVLTGSAGTLTSKRYVAPQGGFEGNFISVYFHQVGVTLDKLSLDLTGGASDATWTIDADFDALASTYTGIDSPRLLWLTLGPELADSASFDDHVTNVLSGSSEWTATFSNWSVVDNDTVRDLATNDHSLGYRLCSQEPAYTYSGTWAEVAGFYCNGDLQGTSVAASYVEIDYKSTVTHDLYVWSLLGPNSGIWQVQLDADTATDTDLNQAGTEILSRRLLRAGVSAGEYTLRLTNKAGSATWFDSFEVVVEESSIPDAPETYSNLSFATDYDTNATIQLTPQRLVWNFDRLGYQGDVNHFEGVFFWNQREKRSGTGFEPCQVVTFTTGWTNGDAAFFEIGDSVATTTIGKSVFAQDTNVTIAEHFEYFINEVFVGVYATRASNVLTVCNRTPFFRFTVYTWTETASGASITTTGDLLQGSEGVWDIDASVTPVLNKGANDWLEDYLAELDGAGLTATVTYGMELLNPPDDPGTDDWIARYNSGLRVLTSTGFGTEAEARLRAVAFGPPVSLTVENHGYETGDTITVLNRIGASTDCGVANLKGAYTITVSTTDAFTLDGTSGYSGTYDGECITVRNLRTAHLAFNSSVRDYLKQAYAESAQLQEDATMRVRVQFGENTYWFFSLYQNVALTGVTAGTPVAITTAADIFATGENVLIVGVDGVTGTNGHHTITRTGAGAYTLDGSTGAGSWTSSTGTVSGGSMAYYDAETKADAATDLTKALRVFWTQDDDPTITTDATASHASSNASADWLRDRIFSYHSTVRTYVDAQLSPTNVEYQLLYPLDTNFPTAYGTTSLPFAQGGRLNHFANFPAEYAAKSGSGLDSILMECLSWGSFYGNMDNARECMEYPLVSPNSWTLSEGVEYLMPIFTRRTPRRMEYQQWQRSLVPVLKFWAWDHLGLFHWNLPPGVGGSVR